MNRALVAGDRAKWGLNSIHSSTEEIAKSGTPLQTPATLAHKGLGDEIDQNRHASTLDYLRKVADRKGISFYTHTTFGLSTN